MVCPSGALISSPSIRMDSFFCGKFPSLRLTHCDGFDVATQTTAALVESLFRIEPADHFVLRSHAQGSREDLSRMAMIRTGLVGWSLIVFESRIKTLPTVCFGQLQ